MEKILAAEKRMCEQDQQVKRLMSEPGKVHHEENLVIREMKCYVAGTRSAH